MPYLVENELNVNCINLCFFQALCKQNYTMLHDTTRETFQDNFDHDFSLMFCFINSFSTLPKCKRYICVNVTFSNRLCTLAGPGTYLTFLYWLESKSSLKLLMCLWLDKCLVDWGLEREGFFFFFLVLNSQYLPNFYSSESYVTKCNLPCNSFLYFNGAGQRDW